MNPNLPRDVMLAHIIPRLTKTSLARLAAANRQMRNVAMPKLDAKKRRRIDAVATYFRPRVLLFLDWWRGVERELEEFYERWTNAQLKAYVRNEVRELQRRIPGARLRFGWLGEFHVSIPFQNKYKLTFTCSIEGYPSMYNQAYYGSMLWSIKFSGTRFDAVLHASWSAGGKVNVLDRKTKKQYKLSPKKLKRFASFHPMDLESAIRVFSVVAAEHGDFKLNL